MTVSATDIALVSEYSVSDIAGSKFTTAVFNYLSEAAKDILDSEDPGLSARQYDLAHANLICHFFEFNKTKRGGMTSEKIGEWSISRSIVGGTTYYQTYRSILDRCLEANAAEAVASPDMVDGVTRSDAEDRFKMDPSDVIDYND
jgi:hypothetical protein